MIVSTPFNIYRWT